MNQVFLKPRNIETNQRFFQVHMIWDNLWQQFKFGLIKIGMPSELLALNIIQICNFYYIWVYQSNKFMLSQLQNLSTRKVAWDDG